MGRARNEKYIYSKHLNKCIYVTDGIDDIYMRSHKIAVGSIVFIISTETREIVELLTAITNSRCEFHERV